MPAHNGFSLPPVANHIHGLPGHKEAIIAVSDHCSSRSLSTSSPAPTEVVRRRTMVHSSRARRFVLSLVSAALVYFSMAATCRRDEPGRV